jgi:hypothetical protein
MPLRSAGHDARALRQAGRLPPPLSIFLFNRLITLGMLRGRWHSFTYILLNRLSRP